MSDYIFGRNAVLELLNSKKVESLYVQKGNLKGSIEKILGKAKYDKVVIKYVDKSKLDELSEGVVHQGVAALVSDYFYYSIDDILKTAYDKNEDPFIIILDEIEDPHNLGAIIRTSEAAGCHGLVIPKRRSATVNSVVHKSSAGATSYLKISKVTNISDTIKYLKEKNIFVYGTDGEASNFYNITNLTGPIALVVGNEGKGISPLVKKNCDELIKIPMHGKINSLNASNAAAIILYEVVRQRNEKTKYLFVDGYNIINSWAELNIIKDSINLDEARESLIDILSEFQALSDEKIILVFDAYLAKGERSVGEIKTKNILVYFTKEKETADQYIERALDKIGRKDIVRVATSDNLIQQTILNRGGTRLSSNELLIEYENLKTQVNRIESDKRRYSSINLVTIPDNNLELLKRLEKDLKE